MAQLHFQGLSPSEQLAIRSQQSGVVESEAMANRRIPRAFVFYPALSAFTAAPFHSQTVRMLKWTRSNSSIAMVATFASPFLSAVGGFSCPSIFKFLSFASKFIFVRHFFKQMFTFLFQFETLLQKCVHFQRLGGVAPLKQHFSPQMVHAQSNTMEIF